MRDGHESELDLSSPYLMITYGFSGSKFVFYFKYNQNHGRKGGSDSCRPQSSHSRKSQEIRGDMGLRPDGEERRSGDEGRDTGGRDNGGRARQRDGVHQQALRQRQDISSSGDGRFKDRRRRSEEARAYLELRYHHVPRDHRDGLC